MSGRHGAGNQQEKGHNSTYSWSVWTQQRKPGDACQNPASVVPRERERSLVFLTLGTSLTKIQCTARDRETKRDREKRQHRESERERATER